MLHLHSPWGEEGTFPPVGGPQAQGRACTEAWRTEASWGLGQEAFGAVGSTLVSHRVESQTCSQLCNLELELQGNGELVKDSQEGGHMDVAAFSFCQILEYMLT